MDDARLHELAGIAGRAVIAAVSRLDEFDESASVHEALRRPAASFVTLRQHGRLRGCIGTLEACRPLAEDVAANARAAALRDPRFAPLSENELVHTELEVSVLSPSWPIEFADEGDLLRQLRPGVDGLIVAHGARRATFLPGVWEHLPDAARFFAELRRKAGIGEEIAVEALAVQRYVSHHSPAVTVRAAAAHR